MSLAFADPAPPPEPPLPEALPDGIGRRGLALSGVLHFVIAGLFIFGLPTLFHPKPPQDMPIAVQLVTMGPETRATHPNPDMPEREAKPDVPVPGPPGPKPEPEPTPSQPPPSAAEAPPVPPSPAPPPPPPKPVDKVEAPRPVPDKPVQVARAEAKAEAKKYDPGQFDALLKNLAAQDAAPTPDESPRKMRVASGVASSQPRAPLGSQLSASELDMIREQIARCWNIPAGARDARDLVVELRVEVGPDGMVQQATIVDQGRVAADPFFRAAAESARRALFNPMCRPLRLPPDKYDVWKDMVVDFSPRDLL
jgi:outer membrane biosynthesis protein TonB